MYEPCADLTDNFCPGSGHFIRVGHPTGLGCPDPGQKLGVRPVAINNTVNNTVAHVAENNSECSPSRMTDVEDFPSRFPELSNFSSPPAEPGVFPDLGYPFNRTGGKLSRWITLVLARIIRGPWASSRPGSGPMQTAWTTWSGCNGPLASPARAAATMGAGGWVMGVSSAPVAAAVRQ